MKADTTHCEMKTLLFLFGFRLLIVFVYGLHGISPGGPSSSRQPGATTAVRHAERHRSIVTMSSWSLSRRHGITTSQQWNSWPSVTKDKRPIDRPFRRRV